MNKPNKPPCGDIELSRYLDGELTLEQRAKAERRLQNSPDRREALQRLQAISGLIQENAGFQLTPEEEDAFDALLSQRLRTVVPKSSLSSNLFAPFRMIRSLSWQWQAAMALSLLLVGYIPVLLRTTLENGPTVSPLINSDYSNCQTFFNANPEAGYDMYGVWSGGEKDPKKDKEKDQKQSPEKTPTPREKSSSIDKNSSHRV